MSCRNPRVQVLVSQEVLQIYSDAAAVLGVSASKLACQILIEASGSIQQMAAVMSEAKSQHSEAAVRAVQFLTAHKKTHR